jgi:alkanesulfonate monooxygenase SsuD/methylene tetrahydromethanopterin reductase-like flavin-dependent oxidoreductase (luciferase family)
MDFGYFGLNMGALDNADAIADVAVAAEQLGYESIWTGEHVVLIDPQEAPSPVPPHAPFVDTVTTLAFAAGKTEKIKLGSGIILLPQRNPIVLAKELAGVDVLSKGRLIFGLGVGYVPGEFEALGIPFEERGELRRAVHEVLRHSVQTASGSKAASSDLGWRNVRPRASACGGARRWLVRLLSGSQCDGTSC